MGSGEYVRDIRITENIQDRPLTSRNRTGRVFFVDTFEHYTSVITEKWIDGGVGVPTIALNTDYPQTGLQCTKLTTGAVVDNTAYIGMTMGTFPKSRFGMEINFTSLHNVANIRAISITIYYYDGTNLLQGALQYLGEANLKWQYYNSAGAFADVTGGAFEFQFSTTYPIYHYIKAVIDFSTNEYVKLLCDNQEYDLSGTAINSSASGLSPHMYFFVMVQTPAAAARSLYVDNIVLTDKEP